MSDQTAPPDLFTERQRTRARIGVMLLANITMAGLVGAWWWPERTEWHYLIVTQCIPLCYVALAWWTVRHRPDEETDV
jgi:cyanate permease